MFPLNIIMIKLAIKKLLLLPLLFLSIAQAETIQCKVTEVIDGNNVICKRNNNEQLNVKLYQIDAPSLDQPYGKEAKQFLSSLILNNDQFIDIIRRDQQQILGIIYTTKITYPKYCDERSKNCQPLFYSFMYKNTTMIENGYAWFDNSFGDNPEYQQSQEEAKKAKRGLWVAPNPIPPWEWRKQKIEEKRKVNK